MLCPQQEPNETLKIQPFLCPSGPSLPDLQKLTQVHQVLGRVPDPHSEECTHKVLTLPRVCLEPPPQFYGGGRFRSNVMEHALKPP